MRIIGSILFIAVFGLLVGCSTSSHVVTGTPRAPVEPEDVRIYSTPPAEYEEIALLQASSGGSLSFSDQAKSDVVIERLKAEAGALGANGLLLQAIGDRRGPSVRTGVGTGVGLGGVSVGTGVSVPVSGKGASAVAIFVSAE